MDFFNIGETCLMFLTPMTWPQIFSITTTFKKIRYGILKTLHAIFLYLIMRVQDKGQVTFQATLVIRHFVPTYV